MSDYSPRRLILTEANDWCKMNSTMAWFNMPLYHNNIEFHEACGGNTTYKK
jgi:hypothetical protein